MKTSKNSILRGARDALEFSQGDRSKGRTAKVKIPQHVDVKKIRAKLKLSQTGFANRFGFSVATVRDWEQSRRNPEGPARALLVVIDREPEAVIRALSPE